MPFLFLFTLTSFLLATLPAVAQVPLWRLDQRRTDLPEWLRCPRFYTKDSGRGELENRKPGDIARLTHELADRHANAFRLSIYWGGETYYQSQVAPPAPGLGEIDYLREALDAARERGVHVITYVNPNAMYDNHPLYNTACLFEENGQPWDVPAYGFAGTRYACINNPAWRDFLLSVITEIFTTYSPDGLYVDGLTPHVCYCEHCRTKFQRDTGRDLPGGLQRHGPFCVLWEMTCEGEVVGDPANEEDVRYSRWLMKCLTDITRDFTQTVKRIKPEAVVIYHTWPKPDTLPYYDGTLYEIYTNRPWFHTLWKRAESANYGSVFPMPVLLNIYLRQEPFGGEQRPVTEEAEARSMMWQTLANGAYPNAWDPLGMEPIFRFMQEKAEYFDFSTTRPVPFLAFPRTIFHDARHRIIAAKAGGPPEAGAASPTDRFLSEYTGMFAALLHARLPVQTLHEHHLHADALKPFRVLVLANEVCLSDAQCRDVANFVRDGGGLIATHETSLYDETGRPRGDFGLAEVLGVHYRRTADVGEGPHIVATALHPVVANLPQEGLPNYEPHVVVAPDGAEVVARLTLPLTKGGPGEITQDETEQVTPDDGWPTVLAHEYGQGRVVYLPGRVASTYSRWAPPDAVALLEDAVYWVSQEQVPVTVEGEGEIGVTLYEQPGRRIVHLVNYNAPWTASYDHLEPLHDLTVRVEIPAGTTVQGVWSLVSNQTLPHKTDGPMVTVQLPEVGEYEGVVVAYW